MRAEAVSDPGWASMAALSPEMNAVLACARAVLDREHLAGFRTALAACPSSDRLCETAIAQGMLGHLHRLVTDDGSLETDPVLVCKLKDLRRLSAQRNLRQVGHLLRILERLAAANVVAMPYKGPVWAETLYGDVTLRNWADLDLLVGYEQIPLAREVLLANGCVDANRYNARFIGRRRGAWGEVEFSSLGQGIHLELHWEVSVSLGARSLPSEELLAQSVTVHLLGREVLSPSPVDSLLIDCVHGTKHWWDSVERILGLAVRVRSIAAANWPAVVAAAREAGCYRRVTIAVTHACRVFGLPSPPEVAESAARDRIARLCLRSLGPESLGWSTTKTAHRDLAALLTKFATEDSAIAGLRHATRRFFRPGPEDWEWLVLPARAAWLYPLLRPGRLALKWMKRLR